MCNGEDKKYCLANISIDKNFGNQYFDFQNPAKVERDEKKIYDDVEKEIDHFCNLDDFKGLDLHRKVIASE